MGVGKSRSVNFPIIDSQENKTPKHTHKTKEKEEAIIVKEICSVEEMNEGEMREFEVENHKLLLIKSNGEFSALGHLCTHAGAPLVKVLNLSTYLGVLSNGRVRCPWHGACFNIKTGDIEEYPCLDALQCFPVEVQNGKVIISASVETLEENRRIKTMVTPSPTNKTVILLIGGGPASLICAETLRQEFYTGRIIIATKEQHLPYDRTKLSKKLEISIERILLRKSEFYSTHGIEMLTNKEAISVNTGKRRVAFKDGTTQQYDYLLIATGCIPRKLSCPGADLENVFCLYTPEDAHKIHELSNEKDVVIVGSSFIGMEITWYLINKAKSVSVVGTSKVPFRDVLGRDVGTAIMKKFEAANVKFYMESKVTELRGQNGLLEEVVLENGMVLPANICVVGIGVVPATDFLNKSGIKTDSNGAVIVNKNMQTSNLRVFAAGDITSFPLPLKNNENVTIRHWQVAHSQGHVAALSMLKKNAAFNSVPYFWSAISESSVRYAGYGVGYEEVIIHGNMDEMRFVAFYIKGDTVIAVCSLNYDPVVSQVAEVLASGKTISKEEASSEDMPWIKKI
ncbi:apoptosis inducing factor mitochondria associated 4 isoform X2 [Hypanus sabinus]|uniref:apoptosis inducing factor mitochondria associated 4 isoform X2 n=2 Tax=Hypanus sabinus TaxID=79690 RepID=UPI0028C3CABE|nr:apoptosis inducing factor mitochondria associated 4 isoform X2 [Hypanus sabinus]